MARRGSGMIRADKTGFGKRLQAKSGFLAAVYLTLAVQLAITAAVVAYLRKRPELYEKLNRLWILWLVLTIGILLLIGFIPGMPLPVKIALVAVFSVILGFTMLAASSKVDAQAIRAGIVSVAAIFVVMSAVGVGLAALGIDLGFMIFVLLAALIALIITFIVMMFIPVAKTAVKAVLIVAMVVFSVFIAFDTNVMLQPWYDLDFIDAAMGLYLSVLNLFNDILAYDSM